MLVKILVNFLTLFFLLLIVYQLILARCNGIEGFAEYKEYDTNNPNNALILAQQNAGNIALLKSRADQLENIYKEVRDISLNVVQLNSQMRELSMQQAKAANNLVGNSPPTITGATTPIY